MNKEILLSNIEEYDYIKNCFDIPKILVEVYYMNQTVLEEIIELKQSFEEGGIYLFEYFSKKRLLKARLEYEIELRLHTVMMLLIRQKISKSEYDDYKSKIENTRNAYIRLLADA